MHAQGAGYTMDHTSVLLLAGPDGRFIAPIAADETAAQMAADLARYLP
jgi:cytochrome oxidase Cu insertion factor (SCO1/SenC/PrrC family)